MTWKNDQVSELETEKILTVALGCLVVPGDYVEMGCYKGDTALLLADMLQRGAGLCQEMECSVDASGVPVEKLWESGRKDVDNLLKTCGNDVGKCVETGGKVAKNLCETGGKTVKKLWIYDSFEGLPEKNEKDESVMGVDFKAGELAVTKREVKERFLRAGLKVPVIKKAWFSELTGEDMPEKIAFAFLDGDFYESIRDSLGLVAPRMAEGGAMIVHDYENPALPGVKRAVDEWRQGREVEICQSMAIMRFVGS